MKGNAEEGTVPFHRARLVARNGAWELIVMAEEKKTYADYLAEIETVAKQQPDWRYGQVAFNVLHAMRHDLSEQIRGRRLDPFHQSGRLLEFHAWVERSW